MTLIVVHCNSCNEHHAIDPNSLENRDFKTGIVDIPMEKCLLCEKYFCIGECMQGHECIN